MFEPETKQRPSKSALETDLKTKTNLEYCNTSRWPVWTESTESVTDWANKTGVTGLLPILNTETWENTVIWSDLILSDHITY